MNEEQKTYTACVKHLDCNQIGSLGHAVLFTSNSTSAMCPMTISIDKLNTRIGIISQSRPALELVMLDIDTGINNIRILPSSSRRIINVIAKMRSAMRDRSKTPGRFLLNDSLVKIDLANRLNSKDLATSVSSNHKRKSWLTSLLFLISLIVCLSKSPEYPLKVSFQTLLTPSSARRKTLPL
jgi:hypothetical protein